MIYAPKHFLGSGLTYTERLLLGTVGPSSVTSASDFIPVLWHDARPETGAGQPDDPHMLSKVGKEQCTVHAQQVIDSIKAISSLCMDIAERVIENLSFLYTLAQ